ncbi:MAG: tRNA (adenosine(37)-N6)-threonylcarbamoyltransferase complex ATPase subunit type 1 TsaE [Firmicutes bacterium]|nr:tRNA (adenosine(37)-N6)-threonylcarbamoyltransferase complex ATPase subunit type 1 TsaE [Bacillota bacterium]
MEQTIFQFRSKTAKETFFLGEITGHLIEKEQVILLSGDLGVGKTVFVQGIASGMEIIDDVSSPTYTLVNEYSGELPLYHMDFYRLEDEIDLLDLGFEDYLDRKGIIIIEWPELAYGFLSPDYIYVKIDRLADGAREITLEAEGVRSKKLIEGIKKNVSIRD